MIPRFSFCRYEQRFPHVSYWRDLYYYALCVRKSGDDVNAVDIYNTNAIQKISAQIKRCWKTNLSTEIIFGQQDF